MLLTWPRGVSFIRGLGSWFGFVGLDSANVRVAPSDFLPARCHRRPAAGRAGKVEGGNRECVGSGGAANLDDPLARGAALGSEGPGGVGEGDDVAHDGPEGAGIDP